MAKIQVPMTKKAQRAAEDDKLRDHLAGLFGDINDALTDMKVQVENTAALMEHLDQNHFMDSDPVVLRRAETRIKRALEAVKASTKDFQKTKKLLKVAVTAVDIDD